MTRALLDVWFRAATTLPRPRITSAFLFTEALHDPLQLECIELARRAESLQVRRTRYDCRMRSWTRLRRQVRTGLLGDCRPCVLVLQIHRYVVSHHAVPEAEQKAWLDGVSFPRAAGCVGYDIVRATDAADHFVVIESWPSKGARLAHTLETDSYEESVYSDATVEEVFRGPGRLA